MSKMIVTPSENGFVRRKRFLSPPPPKCFADAENGFVRNPRKRFRSQRASSLLTKNKIDVSYGNQLKLFGANMFWDETNLNCFNVWEEEEIGVKNWRFLKANMVLFDNLFMSTTETNLRICEFLSGTNLKFWSSFREPTQNFRACRTHRSCV